MELDFDKYCVVDGSPTTVLPAPKRRSKVPSRKSNGKLKCGNDTLSTKEGFTEISFNRYRSASCRDARSSRANREGNEALKRGSVYQSSEELKLLRKNDAILGRKKIELSRGSASAFSFGIIDTLCSLDEDSTLGEENRSSEVLLSEQSTSSFSENQIESSSWDSLNRSLYPIPGRFVPEKVSSSDKREKKSTVAPINGGKSSQERDSVVNLHKSLSAKLALPHSPAQLESDASKASSPKPWFSPVKKMFDPAVRSKSHRSPLHCYNETIYKPLLNDLSDRPHHVEDNSQCEKKDNLNSVPLSSPAHLHGLLKVGNKNGVPSFEFSVKSPEDVYVAKTWKVDNALNWVYTFHSFHHRRKSNASGWGPRDSREPTMIGQMLVSSYLCTELKSAGAYTDSMVTEFVVYDIAQSRRSTSSQDNPSCSPDISKSPLLAPHDDILSNCEQNETIAKTKTKGQSKHPRESGHFELSASQPLAKAELHPELEIAAVAMKVPLEKRESLKFKSGDRKTNKPLPSLLDLSQLVEAKEGISAISSPGEMHVVIPAGNHSLPSSESRGPSPLLDRWRLGGGCDCGGWDMACPLDVFCNPNLRISNSCPLMNNKHPAKLFVQVTSHLMQDHVIINIQFLKAVLLSSIWSKQLCDIIFKKM